MKLPALQLRTLPRLASSHGRVAVRPLHSTCVRHADVAAIVGTGPPPEAPAAPVNTSYRVDRRRRQAEMLKTAQEIRSAKDGKKAGGLKSRFWTNVDVRLVDGRLSPPILESTAR